MTAATTTTVTTTATTTASDRGPVLLALARAAIASALGGPPVHRPTNAPWLDDPGACFVTLKQDGQLRGCIGNILPLPTLYEAIVRNAESAALRDPRFHPLQRAELAHTQIEISLLSALEPIPADSEEDRKSVV